MTPRQVKVIGCYIGASRGYVSLGEYTRAWKAVLAAPDTTVYKHSLSGWTSATRDEVLRQFRDGMDDRINCHIPTYGKGRKWSTDWYWLAWRLSRAVNQPRPPESGESAHRRKQRRNAVPMGRRRVYATECPRELRGRLAHRLSSMED